MNRGADVLLELKTAELTRPGFRLGPVSFELRCIHPGSAVRSLTLLVGRSGSGKSTLLALAAGLLAPTAGHVCLAGQDLVPLNDAMRAGLRRATVAFAAQQPVFLSDRTMGENVADAARRRGGRETMRLAVDALNSVGIGHLVDRPPAFLSGGELARAKGARAVCGPAAVVVLDEPTAMLDTVTADRIRALLIEESARRPLLVATHDEELIAAATNVMRLEEGAVVP